MTIPSIAELIVGEPPSPRRLPLDLRNFLYKGGAACHRSKAPLLIDSGALGSPILARVPLITACHRVLQNALELGGSIHTATSVYASLARFYVYADEIGVDPTYINAESLYLEWTEREARRTKLGKRTPSQVYRDCSNAGRTLANAIGRPQLEFVQAAGVYKPRPKNGGSSFKTNLGDANEFVQDLRDVVACLTPEAILSRLPVRIKISGTGRVHEHYSGLHPPESMLAVDQLARQGAYERKNHLKRWKAALVDTTLSRRYPLYNLRIAAEFMLFIAATGMNRDQASKLQLGDYRFQSIDGGYRVKAYKARAHGEVEFRIISGYRQAFENYLKFRKEHLPFDSNQLFPVITKHMSPSDKFNCINIRDLMGKIGRHWLPAQALRKLKANYIYRASGDAKVEATILQHSPDTFFRHYLTPNHQKAASELSSYFALSERKAVDRLSPARGNCPTGSVPRRDKHAGEDAPEPDCLSTSACLFCAHHKGISSFDYVWGLVSFLELKHLELTSYRSQPGVLPKRLYRTIERIEEILHDFSSRSKKHLSWYDKALRFTANREYHPRWRGFVKLFEGLS